MALKMDEIDSILIRYGDTLSLNALSVKVEGALTPQQCGSRLSQLLDSPDWMTSAQQDQLITQKMRMVIVELEEMSRTTRNAEVLINALERLGNRLERRYQTTERDLSRLYAFQGTVLVDAVIEALDHMRAVVTGGKEVAMAQWDAALETAIRKAQLKISSFEAPAITNGLDIIDAEIVE